MTDNEIIKALECCIKSSHFGECFENKCPLVSEQGCKVGKETLYPYALDLINRLQAENERLKQNLEEAHIDIREHLAENERLQSHIQEGIDLAKQIPEMLALVKAEAYKECIEKVKEEIKQALENNYNVKSQREQKTKNFGEDVILHYVIGKIECLRGLDDFLDNILKELVGDTDAS